MKYLILGRSGAGKDTLAQALVSRGLRILKSYATRPKRYEGEDTHIFVTPEEAKKIGNRIAYTKIGEYEYFATKEQLDECDIYIIDPRGLYEVTKNCPETSFHIVYVESDADEAQKMAISRAVSGFLETNPDEKNNLEAIEEIKEKERNIFNKRRSAEDEQFSDFESRLDDENNKFSDNAIIVHRFKNEYDSDNMENYASYLYAMKQTFDNLLYIIKRCLDIGVFVNQNEIDTVEVAYTDVSQPDGKRYENIPIEVYTDFAFGDTESRMRLLDAYLASENLSDNI